MVSVVAVWRETKIGSRAVSLRGRRYWYWNQIADGAVLATDPCVRYFFVESWDINNCFILSLVLQATLIGMYAYRIGWID